MWKGVQIDVFLKSCQLILTHTESTSKFSLNFLKSLFFYKSFLYTFTVYTLRHFLKKSIHEEYDVTHVTFLRFHQNQNQKAKLYKEDLLSELTTDKLRRKEQNEQKTNEQSSKNEFNQKCTLNFPRATHTATHPHIYSLCCIRFNSKKKVYL